MGFLTVRPEHDKPTSRAGIKPLSIVAVAVLLSACASVGQRQPAVVQPGSQPPAAPATQPAAQPGGAPIVAAAAEQPVDAGAPADNGISRDGQIIEPERFAETPPAVTPPENNVVELNYEQVDLRRVFEELGDALQITMVIDPSIADKVSIRTSPDNPLQYADIWPLMRMLARNAGVTIEQAGAVYRFQKNASNIPTEIVMPAWLNDASSSEVLQVTPLIYITRDAAEEILKPLLQPEGSIIRLGQNNVLGISGTPAQLARVNALLAVVDTDPFRNQGIRLYQLNNSQAKDVAEELKTILALIEGEQPSYQVLGLERINAVLVTAPATRGFEEVNRWIGILDAGSQEQVEQLFFYRVKNLNAQALADTLTKVFQQNENAGVAREATDRNSASTIPGLNPNLVSGNNPTLIEGRGAPEQPAAPPTPAAAATAEIVSANLSVTIVADADTNSLLVRGTPREYRQLLTAINNLDRVPQQVLINAVIGQVTLTNSSRFGIDWTRVSANVSGSDISTSFLPTGLLNANGQAAAGAGLIFTRSFTDGAALIDITLNAIAQDNNVNLLSRPSILTINNQEGEIKVGQSVPVNAGAVATAVGTAENIQYRDVGIVLTITPHINDDGFINLEIFQSLSAVEDSAGGVSQNPIFTNQEISTTAVVSDQSTITLGGLIQDDTSNANTGVPVLRRIPLLGYLFSSTTENIVRRELFVILRPQIIKGDGSDAAAQQAFRNTFEYASTLLQEAGL
ncbi:MAG: type II secretion system secretin GspD [Pseudomonadales bacterium]|nr:type II secretion system secretin GspD [Pseudomonadales bacterium]